MVNAIKSAWCAWTHGGGRIERDEMGRINWQCAKCGRWSDSPIPVETERYMTDRAIARWYVDMQASIPPPKK